MTARLSFDTGCELGFCARLDEWERLSWEQLRSDERLLRLSRSWPFGLSNERLEPAPHREF
jgi:hypothetical protein